MIQNKVSPSSASSSPTPSLALSDAALSVGLSSPSYTPRSHDGRAAVCRTSTVMHHGSRSPDTTSKHTPRVRSISSQNVSKQTPGVPNFSSQNDSPSRLSARSLTDYLPSEQRARHGSSDGSAHSGRGSRSSYVGGTLVTPHPDTPAYAVVT